MSIQTRKLKPSRSLVTVLVIYVLGLSLVSLIVAYIPQLLLFVQARQESIGSQQRLVAKEAANTVASFAQEKFSELEAAVRLGNLASASAESQREVLGGLLGLDHAFRQVILLDSQDHELATASRLSQVASGQLINQAESDLFSQVRQGNRYTSPVYVDEATSEPMIIMAVPATDTFGDFQGTLLAEVNLKFMWDLVGRLKIGETGFAYVVDRQGNLIASGDISRVLRGENVSYLAMVNEFMHNPAPVGEATSGSVQGINGTRVVATYVALGAPDWAVVTELPLVEAQRQGFQSSVILVSVMALVMVLNGFAGVYLARRLVAPLRKLTAAASQIASGEIGVQASQAGPAEVASLAEAFNHMTAQLRELIGSLEQRVASRTRHLQAAAEVARAATAVLDPDELLRQTVDLVRERFGLYYVGLFLLDEERRFAVLRAGTGEAGQKMMEQRHRLEAGGNSMVGQCVAAAEACIALDIGAEAVRFDNPLLPETRSEMALPLRCRGQVLGAMTVQSAEEAAFDEADIAVMQTMADQVAVALDNARLFAESQAALEAERRAYGDISREAWTDLLRAQADLGYRFAHDTVAPVAGDWRPEMLEAAQTGRSVPGDRAGASALAVPIKVRDQVIGVLNLRKSDSGGSWSNDEVALLETLAEQLGIALESARLYHEAQRRATSERLTGEIVDRMRRATDIDVLLQTALQELTGILGVSSAFVQLATPSEPVGDEGGDGQERDLMQEPPLC